MWAGLMHTHTHTNSLCHGSSCAGWFQLHTQRIHKEGSQDGRDEGEHYLEISHLFFIWSPVPS